jgi:hypothetical protein
MTGRMPAPQSQDSQHHWGRNPTRDKSQAQDRPEEGVVHQAPGCSHTTTWKKRTNATGKRKANPSTYGRQGEGIMRQNTTTATAAKLTINRVESSTHRR